MNHKISSERIRYHRTLLPLSYEKSEPNRFKEQTKTCMNVFFFPYDRCCCCCFPILKNNAEKKIRLTSLLIHRKSFPLYALSHTSNVIQFSLRHTLLFFVPCVLTHHSVTFCRSINKDVN